MEFGWNDDVFGTTENDECDGVVMNDLADDRKEIPNSTSNLNEIVH